MKRSINETMDEADVISEIELITRDYLSQDINLDEYRNVDTTVLNPRRLNGSGTGTNIKNGIVTIGNGEEEDNQSHSSGFSSSIPNTVKDIDSVLNEIRIRSSPDPNDFVGYCHDDDDMTEKSYQTNTKLYMELNKAHRSFMGSISSLSEDLDGLLSECTDDGSIDESENGFNGDLENDAAVDLNLLRIDEKYEESSNRYDSNHVGDNHMDQYDNSYFYTPKNKRSHGNLHNEEHYSHKIIYQEGGLGSNEKYSFEGKQHSEPRDSWNGIHYSEKELEEARRQVQSENTEPSTSFFGSTMISCWSLRPRRRTHRRQPEEQRQRQRQRRYNEELAIAILSSRKQTRLFWIATGCSTLAIVFIMLGALLMTTETSSSKFMPPQDPSLIIDDPFYSNSGQIDFASIQTNVVTIDSPTILPTVPAMPSSASTTPNAPTVLPTQFDAFLEPTEDFKSPPPPTIQVSSVVTHNALRRR